MPPAVAPGRTSGPGLSPAILYGFMLVQFLCVGVLVVERVGSARMAFRVTTFVSSLALFAALLTPPVRGVVRKFPARSLATAVLALTFLGMIHPRLNSPLAGIAHVFLIAAVWAPVFWVQRFRVDAGVLRKMLLLFWGFNTLSSAVGVLQVYDPDRFMPDATFIRSLVGDEGAEGLKIKLDDGRELFRPMGLSDSPGGAGPAGVIAVATGLGFAIGERNVAVRVLAAAGAALGMFCVYISQVRAALVVVVVNMVVFTIVLAVRGRLDRAFGVAAGGALAVAGGFAWVTGIGGGAVTDRLSTLTEGSVGSVYYSNRGRFLEDTFESFIPDYPLGAGLGRYGMMHTYFGNKTNTESIPLWAEIQATAWVFDGGVPLLLVGYGAVAWACYFSVRVSLRAHDPRLADCATMIAAIELGTAAQTFGYIPFLGQVGLMFWLLNAAMYRAAMYTPAAVRLPRLVPRRRAG